MLKMALGVPVNGTKLTPLKFIKSENYRAYYLFKCECGGETISMRQNVLSGNPMSWTRSCGCLNTQKRSKCWGEAGKKNLIPYKKGCTPWNKKKQDGQSKETTQNIS